MKVFALVPPTSSATELDKYNLSTAVTLNATFNSTE